MQSPSVKTIRRILGCDILTAGRVRYALDTCREYGYLRALEIVNTALCGHGVEYIRSRQDTSREALGVSYVNMGDPYAATVYFDHHSGRFCVGSWADLVEAQCYRFGEEG